MSYEQEFGTYHALLQARLRPAAGKAVMIDRGPAPGTWIAVPKAGGGPDEVVEIFGLPAKFGPRTQKSGFTASSFYPPEKISNLKYYVRPDEIKGKIVVIDFGDEDLQLDAEETNADDLISSLMSALLRRVRPTALSNGPL